MRLALIGLCLAMTACVPVTYKAIPPEPETRNGDIQVSTPSHRDRKSHEEAAAECAQYGRVARQRGGNDYDCVSPSDAGRLD